VNAELMKFQDLRVSRTNTALIELAKYGYPFSVSGYENDFLMVGKDAKPSATMLKATAKNASLDIKYIKKPTNDSAPQTRSNLVSFHSDFLLKNEAIKIDNGVNPTVKVSNDWIPTPDLSCAKNATRGASDHIRKLTRLGFTLPFTVSTK